MKSLVSFHIGGTELFWHSFLLIPAWPISISMMGQDWVLQCLIRVNICASLHIFWSPPKSSISRVAYNQVSLQFRFPLHCTLGVCPVLSEKYSSLEPWLVYHCLGVYPPLIAPKINQITMPKNANTQPRSRILRAFSITEVRRSSLSSIFPRLIMRRTWSR